MYRIYDVTKGLSQASYQEEFTTKCNAYRWIARQSNKRFYFILECVTGDVPDEKEDVLDGLTKKH